MLTLSGGASRYIQKALLDRVSDTMNSTTERLLELDVRHGELLDKLAWLDQQIDDVLKEWTVTKETRKETSENQS